MIILESTEIDRAIAEHEANVLQELQRFNNALKYISQNHTNNITVELQRYEVIIKDIVELDNGVTRAETKDIIADILEKVSPIKIAVPEAGTEIEIYLRNHQLS